MRGRVGSWNPPSWAVPRKWWVGTTHPTGTCSDLPGGSWWFANVPQWLTIPFLLNLFTVQGLGTASRRTVTVVVALALILIVAYPASRLGPKRFSQLAGRMVRRADILERGVSSGATIRDYMMESWSRYGSLFDPKLGSRLEGSLGAQVAFLTGEARSRARSDRFAVFVPPDNEFFWKSQRRSCRAPN